MALLLAVTEPFIDDARWKTGRQMGRNESIGASLRSESPGSTAAATTSTGTWIGSGSGA